MERVRTKRRHSGRLSRWGCRGLLAAAAAAGLAAPAARADTFTWTRLTAGNPSGSWNDPANWNGGAGPIASGADNLADFNTLNPTTAAAITLDGNQSIGHLLFGDTDVATAASWNFTPGTPTGSTLTLATTTGTPTITVNALGTNAVVRLNMPLAGTQGFVKSGAGTLQLGSPAGTNSFTGNIVSNEGIFRLGLNDQIPDGATFILNGGQFFGADTANAGRTDTFANLIINGSSGNGFQTGNTGSALIVTGTTTVNGGMLTLNSGGTTLTTNKLVIAGGTTLFGANAGGAQKLTVGAGGLVLGNPTAAATLTVTSTGTGGAGGGWVALNGDVTSVFSTGTASITTTSQANGGVLELDSPERQFHVENGTAAIDLNITAILGVNGGAGASAAGSGLVKTGGGFMQLSPVKPNQYTGQTTVNEGTLRLLAVAATTTNLLDPATPLTLGGANLTVQGIAGGTGSQTFGGTFTLTTGGGVIAVVPGGATSTLNVTLPNTWNVASSGASLFFDLTAAGTSTVTSSPIAPNASPSPTSAIIPYASVKDAGGAGFAYVDGAGNIARYTAGTTIQTSTSGTTINLDPSTNYTIDVNANLTLAAASTTAANSLLLTNSSGTGATLNLSGKTLAPAANAIVAHVTGGEVILSNGQLGAANAELLIHKTGGANLNLGANLVPTSGTGSLTIDGDGLGIVVLNSTTATFSGGVRVNVGGYVVPTAGSVGPAGAPTAGPFGTGIITFDGGTIRSTSGSAVTIGNPTVLAADLIMPTTASNRALTLSGSMTLAGTSHLISNPAATPLLLSGAIGDGGNALGLMKAGGGQLQLNGVNTYTGLTSVYVGLLAVNGSIPGSVAVQSNGGAAGGTLGGTGVVGGDVTVAGANTRLAPGTNTLPTTASTAITTGPGVLSITGNLSLASNSTYAIEIGGNTPGNAATNYDQTLVGGSATLGGSTLSLAALGGYTPIDGDTLYILTQGGVASPGQFASLPEGSVVNVGGVDMWITYQANWLGTPESSTLTGGNDVALYVPEPGSAGLLALAAAGLGMRRKRAPRQR